MFRFFNEISTQKKLLEIGLKYVFLVIEAMYNMQQGECSVPIFFLVERSAKTFVDKNWKFIDLLTHIDKNVNHLVAKSVDSDADSEESEEYEIFSELDWTFTYRGRTK